MAEVVVGVRRAATCGTAVRWAADEATMRGLPLTLVHAWRSPVDLTVELGPGTLPGVAARATSRAVAAPPVAALLAGRPELLVLGGHRDPMHLPRTAAACLRVAPCPVVIVRDGTQQRSGRIVVAVCASAASRRALEWAVRESRLRGATLVVVHAWQVRPTTVEELLFPARAAVSQQTAALHRLQGWLDDAPGTASVEVHAVHGAPLDAILDLSKDADLLVLGRGAPSRFSGLLRPSIDGDVSALSPCPVAVIPGRPTHDPVDESSGR